MDFLPEHIKVELSTEDKRQMSTNFKNLLYRNSSSGNNILHLIAIIYSYTDKNYCNRLIDKLLDEKILDINSVNAKGRTCLMIASKYLNKDLINYIINKGLQINFNLKDTKDVNLLEWFCDRGFTDEILIIIGMGCSYSKRCIAKISDKVFRDRLSNILFDKVIEYKYGEIDEDLPEDSDFRIYGENDFIFNENDKLGSGTYGFATIATDRKSGKKVVLKKFQHANGKSQPIMISDQVMRDIIFLREMKKKKHSVQIYGLFTDANGSLYMVLEYLERTLGDQYFFISDIIDYTERIKQYKRLIYEMLICVDGNSRAGIIHCDTKGDNLMIDSKGRVRNIDYGFSKYLGISPLIDNIDAAIHIGKYLMQDGRPENITRNGSHNMTLMSAFKRHKKLGQNDRDEKVFDFNAGFLSYNLDVGSIGLFFIQKLVGYDFRYIFHDGRFYSFTPASSGVQCWNFFVEENTIIMEMLKDKYGDELTKLICRMVEVDNSIRPTAKELIFEPEFDNLPCNYPKDLHLTNLTYQINTYKRDKTNEPMQKKLSEYNSVFSQNYVRNGFVYYDDIIKHWSNNKVTLVTNFDLTVLIDELKFFIGDFSFDSLISIAIYIHSILSRISNGQPCPFTYEDIFTNRLTCLVIAALKVNIYQDNVIDENCDGNDFINRIDATGNYFDWFDESLRESYIEEMKKINKKIKGDVEFFRLTPVMLYVGYIKFILQVVCSDGNKIKKLMEKLLNDIYNFFYSGITSMRGSENISTEYNLFEVVKHLYYSNPEAIDINLRPVGVY